MGINRQMVTAIVIGRARQGLRKSFQLSWSRSMTDTAGKRSSWEEEKERKLNLSQEEERKVE